MSLFRFENKRIRARAIRAYMESHGYDKAVCFSCGNASRELRNAGINTLDVSPIGDMLALRWFTIGEIREQFPQHFDATSGHLPMDCMQLVAEMFKEEIGDRLGSIYLPTGSGETLVCLKMAYPDSKITAVYDMNAATAYEPSAPLNALVGLLAEDVIRADWNDTWESK